MASPHAGGRAKAGGGGALNAATDSGKEKPTSGAPKPTRTAPRGTPATGEPKGRLHEAGTTKCPKMGE